MSKKLSILKYKKKFIIIVSAMVISAPTFIFNIKFIDGISNKNNYSDENLLKKDSIKLIYNESENPKSIDKNLNKVAYITIDDGPSKYTDEIIDILNKYNAKATFFLLENNMRRYPEKVKNIVENGNTAGFHGVSHDIHVLYKNSTEARKEFETNKETFFNITGEISNLVRLPYGSKPYTPKEVYDDLTNYGYKIWDWNLDTQDWKATPSEIVENVRKYSESENKVIILIHEKKQTVDSLESMLKYLSEDGYTFLPIAENEVEKNFWLNNLY